MVKFFNQLLKYTDLSMDTHNEFNCNLRNHFKTIEVSFRYNNFQPSYLLNWAHY